MTESKDFERNTANAGGVVGKQDDSGSGGAGISLGELQLLQAEIDDVTDALLNLAGRLHEVAGFIADHSNRQSAVTKQEANL